MRELKEKKYFLLDMDGTIYLGDEIIDGAKEFLEKLKESQKKYLFLTNNSSKSKLDYVEKLKRLGIDSEEKEIFTSGDATIIYLNKIKKNAKVFLLGTKALEEEFKKCGFQIVKKRGEKIDFVVLGFDTTLTYEKLWIACDYILEGVQYIATHPDFVCPLPGGKVMPDVGSIIELIKGTTGKEPLIIGKPYKYIVDAVLEKYKLEKKEIAIVGDRLYTDIRTGIENGLASVLVMSGETNKKMLKNTKFIPDYIFNSVKDIADILKNS